jgi:hypothetical protein
MSGTTHDALIVRMRAEGASAIFGGGTYTSRQGHYGYYEYLDARGARRYFYWAQRHGEESFRPFPTLERAGTYVDEVP